MKKTIHIIDLIKIVNERNNMSTCSADIRIGWNCLLESVLHDAGVYAGYNNLTKEFVPEGQTPGLIATGSEVSGDKWRTGDDSRRVYFVHRRLQK